MTADHSHVFTMAGYPERGNPIFDLALEYNKTEPTLAKDEMPYTALGYGNGPGGERENGSRQNLTGVDTGDKDYLQQSTVWLSSETHGGDDVGRSEILEDIYSLMPKHSRKQEPIDGEFWSLRCD